MLQITGSLKNTLRPSLTHLSTCEPQFDAQKDCIAKVPSLTSNLITNPGKQNHWDWRREKFYEEEYKKWSQIFTAICHFKLNVGLDLGILWIPKLPQNAFGFDTQSDCAIRLLACPQRTTTHIYGTVLSSLESRNLGMSQFLQVLHTVCQYFIKFPFYNSRPKFPKGTWGNQEFIF